MRSNAYGLFDQVPTVQLTTPLAFRQICEFDEGCALMSSWGTQ